MKKLIAIALVAILLAVCAPTVADNGVETPIVAALRTRGTGC